jgi:putative nucleotidyltransferase with HDIG domain
MERDAGTAIRVHGAPGREELIPLDSAMTPERLFAEVARQTGSLGADAGELERLILIRYFRPNLVRNPAETEAARARARAAVDPVRARVLKGERVVGAHEQIGAAEEVRLQAYQAALRERGLQPGSTGGATRALGAVLYNGLILLIFGLLLGITRRPIYDDLRSVSVFALLVGAVAGAGALVARFSLPLELVPVPFAALVVAVLWEGRLALAFALVLALLLGGQTPFVGLTTPLTAAIGGAAAAFGARVISRRSRTWFFISIVALAFAAAAITMGLMRSRAPLEIGASMLWGTVNAIVASILAIGFLPLLESFTRITTDQTLLELSDPTRKLLRRLSLEAPGTYDHTLRVANLAEAASHAIGANGLLARVGTYYHDIGKLVKPQFFIENQPKGRNPHDKLRPVMSSAIIRGHITEGLRLAEEERLPPVIRRFIAEHHGTQPISFFYDRAREADPNATLNPAEYSYPGPKPQSKETAILMLADSAESATRALTDPTPARIHDTVERIVAGKIAAGQLDECPLTLREVGIIKEQMVKVLEGMYHHRIDYPPAPPLPAPVEAHAPEPVAPASGAPKDVEAEVLTGTTPPEA